MKIVIGSDHGGFQLKESLKEFLKKEYRLEDVGTFSEESVDYPDIAKMVAEKVVADNILGILICGTGIGISMAAGKIKGIRCALCTNEYMAEMSRRHNDANILALGGRVLGEELAKSIVLRFLESSFEGGRHQKRVEKIGGLQ